MKFNPALLATWFVMLFAATALLLFWYGALPNFQADVGIQYGLLAVLSVAPGAYKLAKKKNGS